MDCRRKGKAVIETVIAISVAACLLLGLVLFLGHGGFRNDEKSPNEGTSAEQKGTVASNATDAGNNNLENATEDSNPKIEPTETEPMETEPIETEPIETEPIETEPTETVPETTEGGDNVTWDDEL